MKKRMIVTMLIVLCMMLAACSPAKSDATNFTLGDDVDLDADDIAARMAAAMEGQGTYMEAADDVYDFYFGQSEAYPLVDDICMMFARKEADVGEFGVFEAEREQDVPLVRDMVQKYFDDRTEGLRALAANYSPKDLQKIDNAGIEVYGRYVVYYILDEVDKTAALDAVEDTLRAK